jgi:hypothetical protein
MQKLLATQTHIMRKIKADSFATLVELAGNLNLEPFEAS